VFGWLVVIHTFTLLSVVIVPYHYAHCASTVQAETFCLQWCLTVETWISWEVKDGPEKVMRRAKNLGRVGAEGDEKWWGLCCREGKLMFHQQLSM